MFLSTKMTYVFSSPFEGRSKNAVTEHMRSGEAQSSHSPYSAHGVCSPSRFAFAPAMFLEENLARIERMPEDSLENIVSKYVEMNIAHPFREGNGRSTRIWLDLMLKKNLGKCVDWSRIEKKDYLQAMQESPVDARHIFRLIEGALTSAINDREIFLKGIDYSYYYEEADE